MGRKEKKKQVLNQLEVKKRNIGNHKNKIIKTLWACQEAQHLLQTLLEGKIEKIRTRRRQMGGPHQEIGRDQLG